MNSPFNKTYWLKQEGRLKETEIEKEVSKEIRRSFLFIYNGLLAKHKDVKRGGFRQW